MQKQPLLFPAILLLCILAGSAKAQNASDSVKSVLDKQVADWNGGRLEEFMTGYWRSPDLTFFSGGTSLKGWEATLERYRKTYQADGREMGKLTFSELDIQPITDRNAVVRGRFELRLSDGSKPTGLFTLILRKFDDGWKIVHDHTSSN